MSRKVVLSSLSLVLLLSLAITLSSYLVVSNALSNDLYADVVAISDLQVEGKGWRVTLGTLASIGLNYQRFSLNENLTIEDLDLLRYPLVIFEKHNRSLSSSESSLLESYLAAGGSLLVTGIDSLGNPNDSFMANVVRSKTTGNDIGQPDLYVSNSDHPIMNGPYGSFPVAYHVGGLQDNQDRAQADTKRGAVSVAKLANGYDKIIATQTSGGRVVYWNGDGVDDWSFYDPNCTAIFKNAVKWLYPGPEHDLVAHLLIPTDLPTDFWGYLQMEPGWTRVINATVWNRGRSVESNVGLQLLFNETVVDSASIPELRSGAVYMLTYAWTPSATATFVITTRVVPVTGENMVRNNIFNATVRVLAIGPRFHLDPARHIFSTFPSNFTTSVRVENVTNMIGYQLMLSYDPFIWNITKVSFPTDFVFNYTLGANLFTSATCDHEPGVYKIAALILPGEVRLFSGDGILCRVEGTVLHSGQSNIQVYGGLVLHSYEAGDDEGAMYSHPSGSLDVKLQAGEGVVTVIPSYQVVSWNYISEPKTLDFNLTATGGSVSCEIIIPLNVMHGPFRVFVDGDSGWNGYSVAYNSTHIILMLSYELANGVHNIKVVEGVLMYPMGDLDDNGVVNILDISKVAKYWGRHR